MEWRGHSIRSTAQTRNTVGAIATTRHMPLTRLRFVCKLRERDCTQTFSSKALQKEPQGLQTMLSEAALRHVHDGDGPSPHLPQHGPCDPASVGDQPIIAIRVSECMPQAETLDSLPHRWGVQALRSSEPAHHVRLGIFFHELYGRFCCNRLITCHPRLSCSS